ncbi:MAG: hypothetical protein GC200_04920 [Tepidisphaera sp.]|nr:hypothetical protein [Tepidisphaera sp.]
MTPGDERGRTAILIVTGAHLAAETHDRPLAYALREQVLAACDAREMGLAPDDVIVCSDLWMMNHDDLRALPTICVGAPGVNALAAFLASRVPSVLAVEGVYVVQMQDEPTPVACCWGRDEGATAAAVEAFVLRHLEAFLDLVEGAG